MQQWLNDPKNRPIVYGIAGLVMVGAIVFILFQLQVFGGPQPYMPAIAPTQTAAGSPPAGPPPGTSPNGLAPGPGPGTSQQNARVASGPGSQTNPPFAGRLPGGRPMGAPPGAPGFASAPGSAGSSAPGPQEVAVASVPDARADPFAPYGGVIAIRHIDRPRVDTFAPSVLITDYVPPTPPTSLLVASTPAMGTQQANPASLIGRVSGVMLGNGAYALIDNNGQSSVLQPGDPVPGGGQLISIESDSISVKINGQIVKVPISTDENTPPGSQQGPPGNNYGPPGNNNGPPGNNYGNGNNN